MLVWDQNRIGALAGIQEEEFERAFTYDSLGRVTAETVTKSGASVSIGYTYSSTTGDLVAMTYPSGNVIQFTRDANGQISAIQAGNISLATEITRLPFGPIKIEKLRGVLPLTRTFDQRYQMSRIQAGNVDVQYTRDAAGRVTNVTGIAEPTLSVGTEAYSVNSSNNQMTARGTVNYTYDAAGNLASDGTRTFTWDALGRLKQVQQGNQTVATYGYDIQNRRFRKTVGSTTTYYLYNLDDQLIAEISGAGTVLREYVWLDGEPFLLAEYTGANAGMYFYLNDHLGTPQQLLNGETGAVAWQAAYLPFGEAQVQVSTVTNNLRFPGQYYDAETGLHYNWNRYYDPKSGRYVSTDPIGLDSGFNVYTYVGGNPVNWIDPWGLWVGLDDAVFTGGGAIIGILGRGLGDLLTGNLSSWKDYAGAAIGGAIAGEVLLYTANPFLSGAAGGLTSNLFSQTLKKIFDEQCEYDVGSALFDTVFGSLTGFIPGRPRLVRINAGRGSDLQIFRQMVTKFKKNIISGMKPKTAFKMGRGAFYGYAVGHGAAAGAVASHIYNNLTN